MSFSRVDVFVLKQNTATNYIVSEDGDSDFSLVLRGLIFGEVEASTWSKVRRSPKVGLRLHLSISGVVVTSADSTEDFRV
jgi:hypothetical protein